MPLEPGMTLTISICGICFDFDVEAGIYQQETIKNSTSSVNLTTFARVESSARAGCRTCRMLLEAVKAAEGGLLPKDRSTALHILLDIGLPVRMEYQDKRLELFISKGVESPWPSLGHASLIEPDLTHAAAAGLAKNWLQRCIDKHATCQKHKPNTLPTRVLKIGSESPSQIRLCSTQNETAPYIALSYCWGYQDENLTTTRETLSGRMSGIDWETFPNTVRDAISIARILGIQYLWVDALCIIQDDIDDWEAEAANMAAIYEGATLVISATRAVSATEGFIKPRRPLSEGIRVWKLELCDTTGKAHPVFVREQLSHRFIIPDATYPSEHNPLLSRGWAFQERLLARRTLHFLDSEVIWECRSQFWCECSSCQVSLKWRSAWEKSSLFSRAMNNPAGVDFTRLWHSLIADYSTRQFTKVEDTLPALSGIVRKLETLSIGPYCAGLWRKDLEYHLLWQSEISNRNLPWKRQLGPSWSWTSVPYPVQWSTRDLRGLQPQVKVLHVDSSSSDGPSSLGRFTSSRIELLGRLTSAFVDVKADGIYLWKGSFGNARAVEEQRFYEQNPKRLAKFHPDVPYNDERKWRRKVAHGQMVSCILFYSTQKLRGGLDHHGMGFRFASLGSRDLVWGALVVIPAESNPEAYERVGIVEGEIHSQLESGWFDGIEKSHITLY